MIAVTALARSIDHPVMQFLVDFRHVRRVKVMAVTTIAITITMGMNQPPISIFASRFIRAQPLL
jgi:hypothetical protein